MLLNSVVLAVASLAIRHNLRSTGLHTPLQLEAWQGNAKLSPQAMWAAGVQASCSPVALP
eukprot:2715525-Pyramimonas_sp.AAC.2